MIILGRFGGTTILGTPQISTKIKPWNLFGNKQLRVFDPMIIKKTLDFTVFLAVEFVQGSTTRGAFFRRTVGSEITPIFGHKKKGHQRNTADNDSPRVNEM